MFYRFSARKYFYFCFDFGAKYFYFWHNCCWTASLCSLVQAAGRVRLGTSVQATSWLSSSTLMVSSAQLDGENAEGSNFRSEHPVRPLHSTHILYYCIQYSHSPTLLHVQKLAFMILRGHIQTYIVIVVRFVEEESGIHTESVAPLTLGISSGRKLLD